MFYEHKAENVDDVDAMNYPNAVSDTNPEIVRAKERRIPIYSRAEVLGMIMSNISTVLLYVVHMEKLLLHP